MSDVTRLLDAAAAGDRQAAANLLPLVYDELRNLAAQRLAQEQPGQTLQATALVHEAYLRLVATPAGDAEWDNRGHFFAAAAEAMRRILVDNARRRRSQKRGGRRQPIDLELVAGIEPEPHEELLDLDEALSKLAAADAQAAELVKLRYFAGLSIPEAAQVLRVSPRKADFVWAYAKAWLLRALGDRPRS